MILDLARFVSTGRPQWTALEQCLDWLEKHPRQQISVAEVERFHLLYQRASADLAKIATLASESELRAYLEGLVGRAYAEIHETRERLLFRPWRWIAVEFPRAFRRHVRAFSLAAALTFLGAGFGALALHIDPGAKAVLMPSEALQMTPAERVARERQMQGKELAGRKSQFSAELMTHNAQVALLTAALGMTWGFGSIVMLFYNGVVLGAVAYDYIHGGQSVFLLGWLLPHGVIEIPAILIGGETGFVIAHALIGWNGAKAGASGIPRPERLRAIWHDVAALCAGLAVMLVWAGIVEAFLSQYHEPVISYGLKIGFGLAEAALLALFLTRAGSQ